MLQAGYSIAPQCLTGEECGEITRVVAGIPHSRAGARHLMSHREAAALALDNRLIHLARKWLGNAADPFRATLFQKSAATNWLIPRHQDTALPLTTRLHAHAPASALARVIALRVHLDPSGSGNGPLRVVPGSHCSGVFSDSSVAEYVNTHDYVECLVPRGGVLAMRPLLIHSSSKAGTAVPRRVLHIAYADSLDLAAGAHLAVV